MPKSKKGKEFDDALSDWILLKVLIRKKYIKKYGERARIWFGPPYYS